MAQGSSYSDEEKLQAASAYAITGNMAEVSRQTGIPEQTLSGWTKSEWWHSLLGEVRIQNKDRMQSVFAAILDKASTALLDRLQNGDPIIDKEGKQVGHKPVSARDLGVLGAIAYDKMALIAGDPTSRVERVNTDDKLADLASRFAAIQERKKEESPKGHTKH